jgi:hypothetical protein
MQTRRLGLIVAAGMALVASMPAAVPGSSALAGGLSGGSGTGPSGASGRTGMPGTVRGVTLTLQELRNRTQTTKGTPRQASLRRTFGGYVRPTQPAGTPSASSVTPSTRFTPAISRPKLPQTPVDKIVGPAFTDTAGYVPPDTMGAVGPTQFLFSVNGRFRGFTKNSPHTQIFDTDQVTFWGATADASGVSDAHVRYDRTTQRWFIIEIDVPSGNNHILLAVSSGPDLSTATWTLFAIPATGLTAGTDPGCFADYPTPGIDQNAIYIGANMFGGVSPCSGNYLHSNLYVIQKSSAFTSTVNFTSFFNVATGTSGIATIQGVDSVDSLANGYAVAVKETESPRTHLNVWQIVNPGTTSPTLSGPTAVTISAENGAIGGVLSLNNAVSAHSTRPMDDIDDRLFSAVIRNGHLWTAHNIAVDATGNANGGAATRDAMRWYDINVSGLTLNQSGTVFDPAASGYLGYWMGTLMVSGQGDVAMGLNRANSSTDVQAGAVGRLAGDPAGTMSGFSMFQSSTADAYDDFAPSFANRWGDFTYTSLDPCDDMTLWTTQEYVAGSTSAADWGVAAEKLQAPPPATPSTSTPNPIPSGQASVSVAVTGTSTSGSGFYDTPSTLTDACRTRLHAAVSGGVVVNSVTYVDPTHITLNVSTLGASPGPKTLTVTNPDGQVVVANNFFTVGGSGTTFQDSNVAVAFDTWTGVVDATANGGTYRTSPAKGAKATFKFSGTGITWVTRKGPDQGIASVTIDGKSKGSTDLYAASAQGFSTSYLGLASKSHTIVIAVTGTKNAASTGISVALDAFVVGATTTQDSSTKITYDTWVGATSSAASGGTYRVCKSKNSTSTLTFTGTGVDWITATGPSDGMATVTIDGVSKGTFDLYASSVHWQLAKSFTGLVSGSHTIVITVLGTKNALAKSTNVIVDAYVVH